MRWSEFRARLANVAAAAADRTPSFGHEWPHHPEPQAADDHYIHGSMCNCLDDSAVCCREGCACHAESTDD